MEYRRFGKTGLSLSVITLGGMQYPHGWDKIEPGAPLPEEGLQACLDTTQRALDAGINLIETAKGYGVSERLYGAVFPRLRQRREDFFLMTKGNPATYDETMTTVESQLKALDVDRIDLYGWHGINLPEHLATATGSGPAGAMRAFQKLRDEGVIGHIGFSTHGALNVIMDAIETDLFSFVNLHFYYFFQRNHPAVVRAGQKDMGVFIISPNDKGGQLFNPPQKLKDLCAPLNPIQFNARFCLSHPEVHTMSFGMNRPEHFDTLPGIFNDGCYLSDGDLARKLALDRQIETLGDTHCTYCSDCLPCPENINIPEVLRFRNMWKAWDMEGFGKYRYNMLEEKGHWFPGRFASACTDCGDCLPRCPVKLPIPALLRETHNGLFVPKKERSRWGAFRLRRLWPWRK